MRNIKIIKTQTAKITYTYKNIREKLLKTKAVIRFNKFCNTNMMIAKHVHIKIAYVRVIKICFEQAGNWNCPAQDRDV
jgi:hypothetical protein